jgi:hypothetical protein
MRGSRQGEEEKGGLPKDGPGGTADGIETYVQASPEAVGDEGERKKPNPSVKIKPQGEEECGPGCRERRTQWREELTSLSTLVGTLAMLLAVITPSEGAETVGDAGWYSKWNNEPRMDRLMNLDYWTLLPIIVMIVTGLIMSIQRHLGEV